MIIKRYLANNINEAMTRIRYELGKDAIIISQRKVRKPGLKGLFSGKMIEVTAAIENSDEETKEENNKNNIINEEDEFKKSVESIKKLMESEIGVSENKDRVSPNQNINLERVQNKDTLHKDNIIKSADVESVHKEVSELKSLINKVIRNTAGEEKVAASSELEKKLRELDIDEEFYYEIMRTIEENPDKDLNEDEILRDIFERDILVTNKDLRGRVVLVGPTGVGKTTTIAKLAGRLALVEKKKVGLITIDTYRIGAIEQLKTYAEIMNIPFKVVITIKEMEAAIEEMKDCDVVLIDTTGRSSKNTMQISELRAFVQKANPDLVEMVISATTKNRDIKMILKGYSELEYDNIIITKLDETTVYGSLYNIAKTSNKAINFTTVGQNVPDDIKVCTKEEITRFILGEETLC